MSRTLSALCVVSATISILIFSSFIAHSSISAQGIGNGQISGRVTDSQGNSLGNIEVALYGTDQNFPGMFWSLITANATNSSGNYTFSGLRAGLYRIGFIDRRSPRVYQSEFYSNTATVDYALDLVITEGEHKTGINAQLIKRSRISGYVTSTNGNPLENISVTAYTEFNTGAWSEAATVSTNASGFYAIDQISGNDLAPEVYRLGFRDNWSPKQYALEFYNNVQWIDLATDVVITDTTIKSNVNAQLTLTGEITGVVTDFANKPLPDIIVQAYQVIAPPHVGIYEQTTGKTVSTDGKGAYRLTNLDLGAYRLSFGDPTRYYKEEYYNDTVDLNSSQQITVYSNQITANINAQLAPFSRITGTVTDQLGNGLSDIHILVYQVSNNGLSPTFSSPYFTPATDATGRYEVIGLSADTYRLEFADLYDLSPPQYVSEFYDNATSGNIAKDIVVGDSVVIPNINGQLELTSRIRGRVTDIANQGIANISVYAHRYVPNPSVQGDYWPLVTSAQTSVDGSYEVFGLEPGKYRLGFFDHNNVDPQFGQEYYDNATAVENGTDLTITNKSETIQNINVQLELSGQITGVVKGPEGQFADYAKVTIYRQLGTDVAKQWQIVTQVAPNADGHYSATGLSPGNYRVGFSDEYYGMYGLYAPEYYNNAVDIENANDLIVTPNGTTPNIDAQLALPGHITGTVTDLAGNSINNVTVNGYRFVTTSQGNIWRLDTVGYSDPSGNYDIGGLVPGRYKLLFAPNGAPQYADEYYNDAYELEGADELVVTTSSTISNVHIQLQDATAPRLNADRIVVEEGHITTQLVGGATSLLANDINIDQDLLTAQLVTSPQHGGLTLNVDGTFSYLHDGSETTHDQFVYAVQDSQWVISRTQTIEITAVNDRPVAAPEQLSLARGAATSVFESGATSTLANDTDPDSAILTAMLTTGPRYGTLSLNSDGTFTYTHEGSPTTRDFFTYRVDDEISQSGITTVTITINPPASFTFSKTVGIVGITPACTALGEMKVPVGTVIAYCYTIKNIGAVALANHTLVDSHLGTILNNEHLHLTPGLSHTKIVTQALMVSTTNIATWTATVDGTVDAALLAETDGGNIRSQTAATVNISSPTDDQDGDTIPDNLEGAGDPDGDNLPNFLDTNADGDGMTDQAERGGDPTRPLDSDGDGLADFLDADKPVAPPTGAFFPLIRR